MDIPRLYGILSKVRKGEKADSLEEVRKKKLSKGGEDRRLSVLHLDMVIFAGGDSDNNRGCACTRMGEKSQSTNVKKTKKKIPSEGGGS